MNRYLITALIVIAALAATFLIPQTRFLFFGFPEERTQGSEYLIEIDAEETEERRVAAVLEAAGLNLEPTLGDTGIPGHLERLEAGQVSRETLIAYAAGLNALTDKTTSYGQKIPAAFWDVENTALARDLWDSYRIVTALNTPEGEPFVEALTKAYARFHAFKTQPDDGADTALDTALDLFAPVLDLVETVPHDRLLERSPYIRTKEQAAVYLWQQVVSGSTRRNPLTRFKIFDHGFAGRFHVGTIWQYETSLAQRDADSWGVSGFASEFVGPPENSNQIEHMSISIAVQGVLREPNLVLEVFEEFERLTGSASADEAAADEALNRAVRDVFIARFETDLPGAVEELRIRLKGH